MLFHSREVLRLCLQAYCCSITNSLSTRLATGSFPAMTRCSRTNIEFSNNMFYVIAAAKCYQEKKVSASKSRRQRSEAHLRLCRRKPSYVRARVTFYQVNRIASTTHPLRHIYTMILIRAQHFSLRSLSVLAAKCFSKPSSDFV